MTSKNHCFVPKGCLHKDGPISRMGGGGGGGAHNQNKTFVYKINGPITEGAYTVIGILRY